MSGFSAQWLALREPYDKAARNPVVLDALLEAFRGQGSISVVDLACGTGATLRAIGGRLPARQNWRLVDNDLGLLAEAATLGRAPEVTVAARTVDLARDLELALDGPVDLIAASALFDLVSTEWLDRLVVEAAARRLPVYAALTYDGRISFEPGVPVDADIVAALNRHQRGNKGFGPALGPDAAARAAERFTQVGYAVTQGRSDWVLGPGDKAIQNEIIAGFAQAARECGMPDERIEAWLAARRALIASGSSHLRIGHLDIFALPMPIR
ncbi:MAG: class I SAM-dependent methyltransferase [Xanthobacteraceae bacterium]